MQARLCDAHCHPTAQLAGAAVPSVVNGTAPSDWSATIELSQQQPELIAAIGLHPWHVNDAPTDWQTQFIEQFANGAQVVGEIGLDQWIEGHDIDRQLTAFRWQLNFAAERNLPTSIHCLKASEPLLRALHTVQLPQRGIHLHAYAGSAEQVPQLVELGAHFSFHAKQLSPQTKKACAAIRAIPADRLLIETDANSAETEQAPQLLEAYRRAADLTGHSFEALAQQVARNFQRYFLNA